MSARRRHKRVRYLVGVLFGMVMVAALIRQNESVILSRLAPDPVRPPEQTAPGAVVGTRHLASLTTTAIDTDALVVHGPIDPVLAKYPIETYDVTYLSKLPTTERPIEVHARFYLPQSGLSAPAFVFGPGTTGPGLECAPLLERARGKNWGHYDNHMEYYAGQGYAVALVDYYRGEGVGAIHPYFVGEVEGRVMLDAARALQSFRDAAHVDQATVADPTFFAGYSQGAHAALWAEQIASRYAPDVEIAGIIGFAAATDVVRSVADIATGSTTNWLPPYVWAAYNQYYGDIEPASTMLKEPYASTVYHDARSFCIDQLEVRTGHYGPPTNANNVFTPAFLQSAKDGTLAISFPRLYARMKENLAGTASDHSPVLLVAGMKDAVILPPAQVELARRICASPLASVELQQSATGTHYTAMAEGRRSTISWMQAILTGKAITNNCEKYR